MRKILFALVIGFGMFSLITPEAKAQTCTGNVLCCTAGGLQNTCTFANGQQCFQGQAGCTCTQSCNQTANNSCTFGGSNSQCGLWVPDALCNYIISGGCNYTPPSLCGAGQQFCGGCIGACRSNSQTCNQWIAAECPVGSTPAPTSAPVGSCDGCADAGSCSGKGGSFSASSASNHPECAAQGGYCSGTTNCGGGPPVGTPPPGNLSCGQACTSDSQCRNPSAAGYGTVCRGGICENAFCAPGQTIPGANCSCGSSTRLCGQTCGSTGFCAAGQGFCTHINPPGNWYDGLPDCYDKNTYCAGSKNGYSQPKCVYSDTGNSYLLRADGNWRTLTTTLPSGDVELSCQQCGDGFKVYPELCDDGTLNGTSSSNCTKQCQYVVIEITANNTAGTVTVPSGSNVTLDWTSLGVSNVTASDGWSGSKTTSGTEVVSNLTANTTFTISGTQTSTGLPVSASVTVNIVGLPVGPTINLSVNNISAPVVYVKPLLWADYWAGKQGMNTVFRWTTANAANCSGTTLEPSNRIYPFPGGWPYTPQTGWFLWNWTPLPLQFTNGNAQLSVIADPGMLHYGTFIMTCVSPAGETTKKQIIVSALPVVTGGPTGPGQCGLPDPRDPAPPACAPNPPTQIGSITWTWPAIANADQYSLQIVDATTGNVVPVVGIPVGFVNGQANFGCRPNQATPDTCSYTTNLPVGSYRSKVQARSSTALCADSGIATFPADNLPGISVGLCPAIAWWQSGNGSIFTQGNIQSVIPVSCNLPTCNNNLIQDGNGIPGLAIGGSAAAVQTGTGNISSKDWIAKSTLSGRVPDYASFVSLIPVSIAPTDTGASCGGGTFNIGGATTGNGYYWYRHNGDVSITSDVNLNAGRKVILYVDGNLNIGGKITYNPANSFFMPIVKGNITIDPTVTTAAGTPTLTGIFYCDGKFDSGAGAGPLSVLGSVVAKGGVNLQRDLGAGNNFASSENFSISPDLMLNYPGELSFKRPVWHEVAP